jgi:hypothetical protein
MAAAGRTEAARALVSDMCGRFTEGLSTTDYLRAKALLNRLGAT